MINRKSQPNRLVAGRYEIRKSLGRGGFSEVWLAYDRQLDREVALKQLFGSIESEDSLIQLEREGRVHSKTSSSHIVSLLHSFVDENTFYLVLELMDHSLSQNHDPAGLSEVLRWTKQCLNGLDDVHAAGVVHRDIKPSNLFLDIHGILRIGDFGVARAKASDSLHAWSPQYTAPELIHGDQDQVGPQSDLYSLGLVIYELLLGEEGIRKAFPEIYSNVDRQEAIKSRWMLWHVNSEKEAPSLSTLRSDIPEDFSRWVLQLMDKDPAKRFQSALEALAALLGGDVPTAGATELVGLDQSHDLPTKDVIPWRPIRVFPFPLVILAIVAYMYWPPGSEPTSTLFLMPTDQSGLVVFWQDTEIEALNESEYILDEPYIPGRIKIMKDTFLLLDTTIMIAAGDSIKLNLGLKLAHLDSLIQASSLSTLTFVLNVRSSVKIEGVGEQQGDSITFNLPHGKYNYKITAPQYEQEQGSMVLEKSEDERLAIDLRAKIKRRAKKPDPANVKAPTITFLKTLGGRARDGAYHIAPASDGGYVLAGFTDSKGAGSRDAWLIKTDNRGNIEWDRAYGGAQGEEARSVLPTADGGYVVAGYTDSKGAGARDAWVIKTDRLGNVLWDRTYGGTKYDVGRIVLSTPDGGYVVAGFTASRGSGSRDAWLIKTDKGGNIAWDRTYGGTQDDEAASMCLTSDGGYAIAGKTLSKGFGMSDFWLIKTDRLGNALWDQIYGGPDSDGALSIFQTPDGGYLVAGWTDSKGAGDSDAWLIKTDKGGNIEWDRTYGGIRWDVAYSISPASDGGYVVAGCTESKGTGIWSAWLIRTGRFGNVLWDRTYGPQNVEVLSVFQTSYGGYVLAGQARTTGVDESNVWLLRTDSLGRVGN